MSSPERGLSGKRKRRRIAGRAVTGLDPDEDGGLANARDLDGGAPASERGAAALDIARAARWSEQT